MKKTLVLLMVILSPSILFSQDWTYSNALIGNGDITAVNSVIDTEGNILTFGYFTGEISASSGETLISKGDQDYFVAKFDSQSNIIWLKSIGSRVADWFTGGIATDSYNNIYVTGGYQEYLLYTDTDSIQSSGSYDTFLAKYDPDGNAIWCRNVGEGPSIQVPTSLYVDDSDSILLGGWFIINIDFDATNSLTQSNAYKDYYYAKFESTNGDFLWAKQLKSIDSNFSGFIYTFLQINNSYYISGVFADSVNIESDTIVALGTNKYDIHLLKTDLSGNVQWIRKIRGNDHDYSYSITPDETDNIYIVGYYRSSSLEIDSTETTTVLVDKNLGNFDFIILKYDSNGTLLWKRVNGGPGDDRLIDAEYQNGELFVSGYFADTIKWGGVELASTGPTDIDMFVGSIDANGNYRNANSYSGRNNSQENSRSIFINNNNTYTIIRSNSDLLILGDSIYTTSGNYYFIALGVVGCLPISVDNTIPTNITSCYGDSTGSIQVVASGGFGSPWQYSIDNGDTYSASAYYGNLPAGDYPVVVIDQEGCSQEGPLITLTQPDTLLATIISTEDILHDTDWRGVVTITPGSVVTSASGGSGGYTYQLLPGVNPPQGVGTFSFALADSGKYVVAVNDSHNCGPSETDTFEINVIRTSHVAVGGFGEVEVKMYPNPTSGIVTLEMPFDKAECEMEVLNLTGQLVLKRTVYPSGGVINETIDLSDQAKGLYLIRINGEALQSAIVVK